VCLFRFPTENWKEDFTTFQGAGAELTAVANVVFKRGLPREVCLGAAYYQRLLNSQGRFLSPL
jgi:hypothetical protein